MNFNFIQDTNFLEWEEWGDSSPYDNWVKYTYLATYPHCGPPCVPRPPGPGPPVTPPSSPFQMASSSLNSPSLQVHTLVQNNYWFLTSLFPKFREDSTTEFHSFQRLLCDMHVGVDGVQPGLDLLQLLCGDIGQVIVLAGEGCT